MPELIERRQCPTRASGSLPLIAHWITAATCSERQREHYHKCYTCAFRGVGAGAAKVRPLAPLPPPLAKSAERRFELDAS